MTIPVPYGLIAIALSMYAFYAYRKRRKEFSFRRRSGLKGTRQEWLDHQLGRKTSDIILYGQFMDQKIAALSEVGRNGEEWETYYLDNDTGEKWIKEYPQSEIHGGGPAQLRKVQQFPFEQA